MSFQADRLYLALRPSSAYSALLLFAHLIALVAVVISPFWSGGQTAVLVSAIVASGVYRLYRFGLLRHPASIVSVYCDRVNDRHGDPALWRLRQRDGEILQVALLSPLIITPWFIVLRFKRPPVNRTGWRALCTGAAIRVVIANDSLAPATLRRSRVFFRFALSSFE